MKTIKNTKKRLSTILLPLFAFMLVLSTVLPSVVSAAAIEVTPTIVVGGTAGFITAEKMESAATADSIEVVLELKNGQEWAHDLPGNQEKKDLIRDSMIANVDVGVWDAYKEDITFSVGDNKTELTMTFPKPPTTTTYNISDNQVIKMNLSPALIEKWQGEVTPVTFKIYAKPQISMSGSSVMPSVTAEELKTGGKTIELSLVNATWDKTVFYTMTNLKEFLGQFNNPIIADSVNLANPNDVIEFPDSQTLLIKLPAIPDVVAGGDVIFTVSPTLASKYATIDEIDGSPLGTDINEVSPMSFNIKPSTTSSLVINPIQITEADVITGSQAKLTLELTGTNWSILTDAKKKALIDALVAKDQPEQWQKVKNALSDSIASTPSSVEVDPNNSANMIITIPAVAGYELTANQTISLKVPYQLLENDVGLNEKEFTIKATPKALISGTATPTVSQTDFLKGGKTIVITLVNAKWAMDVASNTPKREELLSGLKFLDNKSSTNGNANADAILEATATIAAGANVQINKQIATITLPEIPGFKITNDLEVNFAASDLPPSTNPGSANPLVEKLDSHDPETLVSSGNDKFTITSVDNQTATISGSITTANEFDIVKGDKVITITLKNDIWTTDQSKLDKLKVTDAIVAQGNIEVELTAKDVQRTSDTVLTITLKDDPDFTLTEDTTVTLGIPATLLSISSGPVTTSAFKISAVKAELPNGNNLTLDKEDIKKGGKTITITLKNATFKTDLPIDALLVAELSNSTDTNWELIEMAFSNDPKSIKVSKDKVTIKLPKVPGYNSTQPVTINLKIPARLINHLTPRDIDVIEKVQIGAVASAQLNKNSITNEQIKTVEETLSITLTGTKWDPTLTSNNSKKTALLKGFTVTDQTKEWALLSKEISSKADFEVTAPSEEKSVLTITLPKVPGYSIIRDQIVDIKIPKSVLMDYKDEIMVTDELNKFKIIATTGSASDKSLGVLTAVELANAITAQKRVIVPNKKVETIYVNTIEFPSSGIVKPSITTIEVTTTSDVQTVDIAITEQTAEKVAKVGNKSTFIYMDLPKNSDLIVSVFDGNSKPLQTDIHKKIGKGSKTYNEIPKKDYTGSYLVYDILTDKSLLKEILKYYSIDELKVTN